MQSDRFFIIALALSVVAHGAVLVGTSRFSFPQEKRDLKKMQVRYLALPRSTKPMPQPDKDQVRRDPLVDLPDKLGAHKLKLPPLAGNPELAVGREKAMASSSLSEQGLVAKPSFSRPEILAVKKRITLSQTDVTKNSSPAYLSYSTMCREKVKRAAYENYMQVEEGEVYISFVVSSDGLLRDVRLFEDKTNGSPYLREIALKSIRDASPFLKFPKELVDYPQLTFNVVISFETE